MKWNCYCSRTRGVTDERSELACWKLNTGVNVRAALYGQTDRKFSEMIFITFSINIML